MITHDLKVAIRNLLKYKVQTGISMLGLAAGFVCFVLSAWTDYVACAGSIRGVSARTLSGDRIVCLFRFV